MIRLYHSDDKPQLLTLLNLNVPRYFECSEVADFSDYLDNHLETYFVIEEAEYIVGCGGINYFPQEATARISWDIIHPDYHGQGMGRALTLHRIDEIKKNPSVKKIIVRTTQLTYQFYGNMGFELEKIEKNFWAQGFDLYQMKMSLVQA